MSMTTPFPEPDSPDLERFAIYGRGEIVALLRELAQRQVLVTLYFDQGSGFAVSNVLEVNEGFEELIFDCATEPTAQAALYAARELVAVAFLDNVKLQFTVGGAEGLQFRQRPAFRVRFPQQVLRLQRRNHRRQQLPSGRPATCLVPAPGEDGQFESLRVLDLGVGGLAMLAHPMQFELPIDRVLRPCYLDLPDIGQITVALRVRYVDQGGGDGSLRRCGCEFVDLSGSAARMLQRYMNRLDAAQARSGDQRAA
jgi:c-di-GMP-binding flagellar brake protein YcgR